MNSRIKSMKDQFLRAHSGTSFSPEKRAVCDMTEFSEELESDMETMDNEYMEKYLNKLSRYLSARSRCMSTMITGPANFPTARNQKNLNSASTAWDDFRNWRERYFKAVNRKRTLSPEEEIDETLKKLETLKANHEMMKDINRIIRKKSVTTAEKKAEIIETWGIKQSTADKIFSPNESGKFVFESFMLTNSNARIKSQEEKLMVMRKRIEVKAIWEPILFEGGTIDIQNDRVVIFHDEKPENEIIGKLKSRGFRWSRNFGCWCRKHTASALHDAREICKTNQTA